MRSHRRAGSCLVVVAGLIVNTTSAVCADLPDTHLAAVVRHAPRLNGNGAIEGSLQQLSGEPLAINGGFKLLGNLLVPGMPVIRENGRPAWQGIIEGDGDSSPSNYTITLNGNCALGWICSRVDPVPLAAVPNSPGGYGSRNVTLNRPGESFGDASTLRNLTLNGNAGIVRVPPGNYDSFTANGETGFALGIPGSAEPSVYHIERLTLNGRTRLEVLGPVVLVVANGFFANGTLGAAENPSWLDLKIARGGLVLNGGCTLYGNVHVPDGSVFLNGQSELVGRVECDRLTVNGGARIRVGGVADRLPVALDQALSTDEDTPLEVTLAGSDPEGAELTFSILTWPAHGELNGIPPQLVYEPATDFHGPDLFTFKISDGRNDSEAATVWIAVCPVNDRPVVPSLSFTTPEDQPLEIVLSGSDADGDPLRFSILESPTNGVLSGVPPDVVYWPNPDFAGTDAFLFAAHDSETSSAPGWVTITVQPVDDPPVVDAGPDLRVTVGELVQLNGSVQDDEDPEGAPTVIAWSVIHGFGLVEFLDPTKAETFVRFGEVGTYTLQLAASDSITITTDEVTVTVLPINRAPGIDAGPRRMVDFPEALELHVAVSDDGLPENSSVWVSWSKLSGSGDVLFSDAVHTNTSVSFGEPGEYVLMLRAGDSDLESSAQIAVTVRLAPTNQPPIVDAGPNRVVGLTNRVQLNGRVTDDGLPKGAALSTQWSVASGPGWVEFENQNSASTRVSFGAAGLYELQLSVSDSEATATDTVHVTVYPFNHPPEVDAGPDLEITLPDPSLLYPNPFAFTNATVFPSRSLAAMDRWDTDFGRVGLTGLPAGTADVRVNRNGLSTGDGLVVVAGAFTNAGGVSARSLARFDGVNWMNFFDTNAIPETVGHEGVSSGKSVNWLVYDCGDEAFCLETFDCVAVRGNEVFVGGLFKDLGNLDGNKDKIARWDGERWRSWVFKEAGNHARVIKATPRMVYVGGYFAFQPTNATSEAITNLPWAYGIATWDGTNWGTLESGITDIADTPHPVIPALNQYHAYVNAIAVGSNDVVYAAGKFRMPTRHGVATNIALWDGIEWRPLGAGLWGTTESSVLSLECGPFGELYAGGVFSVAGTLSVRNLARWDGAEWHRVGEGSVNGVNGAVEAIAIHQRDVYVGGSFTEAGGFSASHVARWNGHFWSPLGLGADNGVVGKVFAMACDDSALYIGGTFNSAGGAMAKNIARWEFVTPPLQEIELNGRVTDDGLPEEGVLSARWSQVSGPGEARFANANAPRTSVQFSEGGTYVLRLSADDSQLTALDEVTVVVRANQPPSVHAGTDRMIGLDEPLPLNGFILDDGLPESAGVLHVWSMIHGPAPVLFDHPERTNAVARFPQQGTYILRLAANDSQFSAFDELTVIVGARNQPPNVHAGPVANVLIGTEHGLNGTVTDDGFPDGSIHTVWSVVSGPGIPTFENAADVDTKVRFNTAGIYVLRLAANDSELSASSDVTIFVQPPPNSRPVVNAGPDQTITNLSSGLSATVSDDGRPWNSALVTRWRLLTVGAIAHFSNSNSPDTTVTFDRPGTYALEFSANDGEYSSTDSVIIKVLDQPPMFTAGPDRAITWPTNSVRLLGCALDSNPLQYSWYRISGPGSVSFNSPGTLSPTATFSVPGVYIIELRVSEGTTSYTDRVTVVVASPGNGAPGVDAGVDMTATLPTGEALLQGTVEDDGLPAGEAVSLCWNKVAGPGPVTFDSPTLTNAFTPQVRTWFEIPGTYIFRLTATDSVLTNGDDVLVTVLPPPNAPPCVELGPDLSAIAGIQTIVSGNVTDDGLPEEGILTASWKKLSGPGLVTFGAPTISKTNATPFELSMPVSFNLPGTYVLRLMADDTQGSAFDDVTIVVKSEDPNEAPWVSAGLDASTMTFQPFFLSAEAGDDGLPHENIETMWTVVSGPARVYFSDASSLASYVQFSAPGTYVLRLLATDGQFTVFDDVTLSASAPLNQPPFVEAGPELRVTRPEPARLQGVVLDDGLPRGYPLIVDWVKISGSGGIQFEPNPHDPVAVAHFDAPGEYLLRLSATDSELSAFDEVTIIVEPGTNTPPRVDAGPDFSIALTGQSVLQTCVSDDGLEEGMLEVTWSKVDGPDLVLFHTVNGEYWASFFNAGIYTLRLTASDGMLTNHDDVVVTVFDAAPPVAELHSPADGSIATAPIQVIGTADSAILKEWRLESRLFPPLSSTNDTNAFDSASAGWTTISSAQVCVQSNVLGTLDPTLALNGLYELRLVVADLAGRIVATEPVTIIFDRNLKLGHFTISFTDLAVPLPGLPLQIVRTYDSRAASAGIRGDFGVGWTMDIRNVRLQKNRSLSRNWVETASGSPWDLSLRYVLDDVSPRMVTLTFPDGRVEKFRLQPNPMTQPLLPIEYPRWRFVPIGNTRGTLEPAGVDAMDGEFLTVVGSIPGTVDLYDLNFFYEAIGNFSQNISQDDLDRYPTQFRYKSPEGYTYLVDEERGLQSVADLNGNTLVVTPDALTWTNVSAGTASMSVAFERDSEGRIVRIIDAAGNAMQYRYDADTCLAAFVNRDGETNQFTYDANRRLVTMKDSRGVQVIGNEFDASGRLVRTTDAAGNSAGFLNDLDSGRQFVTNRLGFVTVHEFDDFGNIVRTTDPTGAVTTFTYDARGNLLVRSNANACACAVRYEYDDADNRITETDANGSTTRYTYNHLRKIQTVIERSGLSTTNEYDHAGNLVATRDSAGQVSTFTYNALGKVISITDPRGFTTRFDYNALGFLTSEQNALGHVTEFVPDANGNVLTQSMTITRVSGLASLQRRRSGWMLAGETVTPAAPQTNQLRLVMRHEYTPSGLPLRTLYYDSSSSETTYTNGRPLVSTDSMGRQTQFEYDSLGQLTRKTHPDGCSEQFDYDAEGRLVSSTDKRGFETRFEYDPRGKLLRTVFADGSSISATYYPDGSIHSETSKSGETTVYELDGNGNRTAVHDASGVTRYSYDSRNFATSSVDPLGRTNRFEYDALGRNTRVIHPDGTQKSATFIGRLLASETDETGTTTSYEYDALGRVAAVTNVLGDVTRYSYDEQGNRTSETDALGRTTWFEYDVMGRCVRTVFADGSSVGTAYDTGGRVVARTNQWGDVTRYEYDAADRLIRMTDPLGRVTRSTYDCNGNRLTHTEPDGSETSWEYDSLSRVIRVTTPCGTSESFTYDAAGRLVAKCDASGRFTTYGYDTRDRLVAVTNALGESFSFHYDPVGNRISETDPLGQVTSFTYDSRDRLVRIVRPDDSTEEFSYDPVGRLVSRKDPAGAISTMTYDALGQVIYAADPLGQVTAFQYDAVGNRVSETTADGRTTRFAYDALNRCTHILLPDGTERSAIYDKAGYPVATFDGLGNHVAYEFDSSGQLTALRDEAGKTTRFTYNAKGRLESRTDPLNQRTAFEYDCRGNVARVIAPDGGSRSIHYDERGLPLAETGPNGHTTHFSYDPLGRLIRQTDPLGNNTRFSYDALGRLASRIDAKGRVTQYQYDSLGRLVRVTRPDGTFETATYDAKGRRIETTDPAGHSTWFAYDANDRVVAITNALGEVYLFGYDADGRMTSQTDPAGYTTAFEYDPAGRLTRTTFADGTFEENQYDSEGRRIAYVDPAGAVTSFGYDALGHLIAVTNAMRQVTRYDYDAAGRMVSQTDANGNTTLFQYDAMGRRVGRTLPGGQSESFAYDLNGNLVAHTNFNGRVTVYTYDAADRLTAKIPDPELLASGAVPVTFAYDAMGLRTNMTDASGTTDFLYDARDRLIEKKQGWGPSGDSPDPFIVALKYARDANGNITDVVSSNPNGTTLVYEFDALNRLTAVNDLRVGRTAYTYDRAGQVAACALPNALTTWFARDARHRVTNITTFNAQGVAQSSFSYARGPAGHRLADYAWVRFDDELHESIRQYRYDPVYRLTNEVFIRLTGASLESYDLSYEYDAVGNRLLRASDFPGLPTQTFSYDANDRLTSDEYDPNGNTVLAADWGGAIVSDRYDFENRLIERETTIDGRPATVRFTYDGDGNRTRKTVTIGTNPTTTCYVVDDLNPTGYPQDIEELALIGSDLATATVTRVNSCGLTLLSQDCWTGEAWVTSFHGADVHGSIRSLTDLSGQITDACDYDAFGNLVATRVRDTESGVWVSASPADPRLSVRNPYQFAGERFDPDLGLYFLRARYADPGRGRFWTMDAFEGFIEDPASRHAYAFNQNDPVNRMDPSGTVSLGESMAVSVLAPVVRGVLMDVFEGVNNYSHGLAGGSTLKFTSRSEAYMIDSLAAGPGWKFGKPNFWAASKGAPFLLLHNPNIVQSLRTCWYECIPFDLDVPVYGPGARHPIFEFEPSELYKYLEAGTAPLLFAGGVANNFVDAVRGMVGLGADVLGSFGYAGTLALTGGNLEVAEQLFGPELRDLNATASGAARLVADGNAAQMYYLSALVDPGLAEEVFGARRDAFGLEAEALFNDLTGGEGQMGAYRAGYGLANVSPALLGKLGKFKALAQARSFARLSEGTRALATARKSGLLADRGAASKALISIPPEICKPSPRILDELERVLGDGTVAITEPSRMLAAPRKPVALLPQPKAGFYVSFMGKAASMYYDSPTATLGGAGRSVWLAPAEDYVRVSTRADAVTTSGHAPSVLESFLKGENIYGIAVPGESLGVRVPTIADAGRNRHWRPGGYTGVEHAGSWRSSGVREYVTNGGSKMPRGSVFFELMPDGSWRVIRRY